MTQMVTPILQHCHAAAIYIAMQAPVLTKQGSMAGRWSDQALKQRRQQAVLRPGKTLHQSNPDSPDRGARVVDGQVGPCSIVHQQAVLQQRAASQASVHEDEGPHSRNCMSTPAATWTHVELVCRVSG